MKKRNSRKPATTTPADAATRGPSCLPVELHKAWLQYLSQPELLRVGAVSKAWRALVLDEPRFYLSIFLQTIRGRPQQTFIQRLNHASRCKVPIGVTLDFPYALNKASCDILTKKVFPAIERVMPYVRKLSIVSASPLPASALEFLQAPAPELREFVYKIDPEYDPGEDDWGSDGGSNYGDYVGHDDWDHAAQSASSPPLPTRLFGQTAPKLKTLDLYAIPLPGAPLAAFSYATRASLGGSQPVPSIGLSAHFPAAKHMKFTLEGDSLGGGVTCSRAAWLPAGLTTLDVHVFSPALRTLCQLADLAAVQHLRVAFDWQYDSESYGILSSGISTSTRRVDARDAAWAACLAHLTTPRSVDISCTARDWDGHPVDVRVAVADGVRSVTFYAEDVFVDELDAGVPYEPLASLHCLAADLAEISVCQAHLQAVFHITKILPALREIRVTLSARTRAPFWDEYSGASLDVECPALERLVLSCDNSRWVVIASDELARFAGALRVSTATRPRLILQNVLVVRGTGHAAFFAP